MTERYTASRTRIIVLGWLLMLGSIFTFAPFIRLYLLHSEGFSRFTDLFKDVTMISILWLLYFDIVLGIVGGIALIKQASWARAVAFPPILLGLFNMPLGTAISLFGFFVFLVDWPRVRLPYREQETDHPVGADTTYRSTQAFAERSRSMSEPWVHLQRRYGGDSDSPPTEAQLAEAIKELYHETLPDMTEGDYAEHGAGSLRYGYNDGPMFVLEVNRLREVSFDEWADQDYERELALPRRMRDVSEQHANRLWKWLAQGEVERIRSEIWETT